ncbi:YqaJ viral recombinase family protein, partial [Escherichia coli]|uniref:YqaJ viral recombinase family protein n=1 Tax=Escherichia coli TaxID=562 RepID=UPI00207BBDFF
SCSTSWSRSEVWSVVFVMLRLQRGSKRKESSAGSDGYKRQVLCSDGNGLELKCPFTSRDFMKFRLGGFEAIKSAYMAQVQYSMWVTRKDAWYFANYDPRMKREGLHYVVIERNEKYMASFDEMVPEFIEKMDEALAEIGFVYGEQW